MINDISYNSGLWRQEMDIEKLKNKRQLNVKEQNALEEYQILSEASYWRERGFPNGLIKVLNDHHISKDSFEYRNLVDKNFIRNFLEAYQHVFILIRAKPKSQYNIILLKIFHKYLPSVLELRDSDIRMLKKDINSNIELEDCKGLTYVLSKHNSNRRFENFDKIKRFIPILDELTLELITLLEQQEFQRLYDLADAAHNFPEFLITSTWNIDEFWKRYIVPYKKRWDKDFLEQWESLSELSSLKISSKEEIGFLRRVFGMHK